MQYNGSKVFDFQEKGDVFSNFFNSVIKRDDYVTLYEDCFFSDFDISGHFLGNITLSLPCYRIIFGTVGHTKILWTRRYNILCNVQAQFPLFLVPCSAKQTDGGFSKHIEGGKLGSSPQVWRPKNILKTSEENHYFATSQKFFMCFPFFSAKNFIICRTAL